MRLAVGQVAELNLIAHQLQAAQRLPHQIVAAQIVAPARTLR